MTAKRGEMNGLVMFLTGIPELSKSTSNNVDRSGKIEETVRE
jgi:hypothetical protein